MLTEIIPCTSHFLYQFHTQKLWMRLICEVRVFSCLITNCNHKLSSMWSHINAATSGCGAKQVFQRSKWMAWICTGDKELTKGGHLKRPSLSMMSTWVLEAWEDIPAEMMKKSFLKTGISNSMDGAEDNHLWQHQTDTACAWLVCHSQEGLCKLYPPYPASQEARAPIFWKLVMRPRSMAGGAPAPCRTVQSRTKTNTKNPFTHTH